MKILILAATGLILAGCSESKDSTNNMAAETALDEGAESVSQPIEIAPAGGGEITGIDAATGSAAAMPEDTGPIVPPAVEDQPARREGRLGDAAPGPGERSAPDTEPSAPITGNQTGNVQTN